MATHNEVRIVGYLKKDPMIMNPGVEGEEKIFLYLMNELGFGVIFCFGKEARG